MGVRDLLKNVDPLLRKANFYALARGKRVAADGHYLLHLLAYHHAQSIVVDRDFKPLALEFLQLVQTIQGRGVELILTFDGAPTPAKSETDQARALRRAKAIAALQYDGAEADPRLLRAAISLGWKAVEPTLAELRKFGVPYIVAPYEADAQCELLLKLGQVWAIVTCDSDFITHGMSRVFFKVNWKSGRKWLQKWNGP